MLTHSTIIFLLSSLASYTYGQNCLGTWKVIEDQSQEPAAIIKLYQKNNQVFGKLTHILKSDTKQSNPMCVNCRDDRKDQPVIGMELVRGMKQKREGYWVGGRLLDPHTGRTYRGYMELLDEGTLKVRGYMGIALIGRTQYWYRMDDAGE